MKITKIDESFYKEIDVPEEDYNVGRYHHEGEYAHSIKMQIQFDQFFCDQKFIVDHSTVGRIIDEHIKRLEAYVSHYDCELDVWIDYRDKTVYAYSEGNRNEVVIGDGNGLFDNSVCCVNLIFRYDKPTITIDKLCAILSIMEQQVAEDLVESMMECYKVNRLKYEKSYQIYIRIQISNNDNSGYIRITRPVYSNLIINRKLADDFDYVWIKNDTSVTVENFPTLTYSGPINFAKTDFKVGDILFETMDGGQLTTEIMDEDSGLPNFPVAICVIPASYGRGMARFMSTQYLLPVLGKGTFNFNSSCIMNYGQFDDHTESKYYKAHKSTLNDTTAYGEIMYEHQIEKINELNNNNGYDLKRISMMKEVYSHTVICDDDTQYIPTVPWLCYNFHTNGGTKKGDWYIPSAFELMTALQEKYDVSEMSDIVKGCFTEGKQHSGFEILNEVRKMLGFQPIPQTIAIHSCTEYNYISTYVFATSKNDALCPCGKDDYLGRYISPITYRVALPFIYIK